MQVKDSPTSECDPDPVVHVFAEEPDHVLPHHDFRHRTAIIVVPSTGIFIVPGKGEMKRKES